jgi:hypothetical protein
MTPDFSPSDTRFLPSEDYPPQRRFHLGDGLILIAALALTLSVLRSTNWPARFQVCAGFWWDSLHRMVIVGRTAHSVIYSLIDEVFVQALTSLLLGLTLAQPAMRLGRPRPPLRDVFRQSGFVVCVTVIVGTLILFDLLWVAQFDVSRWLSELRRPGRVIAYRWVQQWGVDGRIILASAVLLCWPVLGLPPWRSEASWIDRLGRAVGWGWVVVMACVTILIIL